PAGDPGPPGDLAPRHALLRDIQSDPHVRSLRRVAPTFARARGSLQTRAMTRTRDPIEGVRELCLALPEVNERLSHGAPTFFIRDKKTFATVWDKHHRHETLR